MTYVTGRHSMRFGGEYRRFLNENFAEGTGLFNFPSVAAFMAGTANAFSITLGERRSHITQDAAGVFRPGPDRRSAPTSRSISGCATNGTSRRPNATINSSCSTRDARRWCASASTSSEIYRQNNTNVEPRLGVAWTPSADGRTVVRAAYGWAVDQPSTTVVRDTAGNPPFATPLTASGAIPLA